MDTTELKNNIKISAEKIIKQQDELNAEMILFKNLSSQLAKIDFGEACIGKVFVSKNDGYPYKHFYKIIGVNYDDYTLLCFKISRTTNGHFEVSNSSYTYYDLITELKDVPEAKEQLKNIKTDIKNILKEF